MKRFSHLIDIVNGVVPAFCNAQGITHMHRKQKYTEKREDKENLLLVFFIGRGSALQFCKAELSRATSRCRNFPNGLHGFKARNGSEFNAMQIKRMAA